MRQGALRFNSVSSLAHVLLGACAIAWCILWLAPPMTDVGHWIVMLPAMMAPLILPLARKAIARVYARERGSVLHGFLFGYVLCWLLAGVPAILIIKLFVTLAGPFAAPLAFALAALWHVTPARARAAKMSHGLARLPRGDAADAIRLGLHQGMLCIQSCGPLMVAAMTTHSLAPMLLVTLLLLAEANSHRLPPAQRIATLILVIGLLPAPHPHKMEHAYDPSHQTDRSFAQQKSTVSPSA